MAEEHGFQEGPRLCANNCGFFGSSGTLNLCSKCFRDFSMNEEQAATAKSAVEKSLAAFSSSSGSCPPPRPPPPPPLPATKVTVGAQASSPDPVVQPPPPPPSKQNRCISCRKRVGFTGFQCRCGSTFCGSHRYPELHGCPFDFKVAGREAIARDNPAVLAPKLDKI